MTTLELENSQKLIFKTLSGSHSYNLNIEGSDRDYKGIFIIPSEEYLSLNGPQEQINDSNNDISYYALRRFLELAGSTNPNIIEMLYTDSALHEVKTPEMDILFQNKGLFISKQCIAPHLSYAEAQIKKAKGRNKWINNPQAKEAPKQTDFCWVTPLKSDSGFRPLALAKAGIDLTNFEASSLEHHKNVYRLYALGKDAKGVFSKDGQIKCQSISKTDEKEKFWGLLTFNEEAYKRVIKDHKNYWQWMENRNEKRWLQQESGELDYDAKNMMHTIRLLYSGIHILENSEPLVKFEGTKRQYLLDVRSGKFKYNELLQTAEELASKMRALETVSKIPEKANIQKIDQLHLDMLSCWKSRT
ncbi:MAG: nucleotidyltransferase domain-containing protein [Lentisphaeraceae bacterium]|nr:nucleotidyltransferase domain-containing protein [Lentisphaeraceae bacterium]